MSSTYRRRHSSARTFLRTAVIFGSLASAAHAEMRITEYMYSGVDGEFVEFTNVGASPIDMTGWSFDDDSAIAGTVDLSAFGVVAPGQSVILTEASAANFASAWDLSGVTLIGDLALSGLSRSDTLHVYDNTDLLQDSLSYGDELIPNSIRAKDRSGWPCAAGIGANDILKWRLSTVSDAQGSWTSVGGDTGNPGTFDDSVPECPDDITGACCWSGNCTVLTETACSGLGLWQGAGTNCGTLCPQPTNAEIRITEFMYAGVWDEFVEFTNMGLTPVDMTGWSCDDQTAIPGTVDLSAFGTIAPGDSVVLTGIDAGVFSSAWGGLPTGSVLSGLAATGGLGRNDSIILYDDSAAIVDQLAYGDETFLGTISTNGSSGWPCEAGIGTNDPYRWWLSAQSDAQGSFASAPVGVPPVSDIGNPGTFVPDENCPILTGSCCVAGDCSVITEAICLGTEHGLFLGANTNCTTTPCPAPTNADIRITEYMYSGAGGEFIEFTNLGTTSVDMTGWSVTDQDDYPGATDLSAFGSIAAGESVVLAEQDPGDLGYDFVADWSPLAGSSVVLITDGFLQHNDVIHLYDPSGTRVDRLAYGDGVFPLSINANGASGWPCATGLGADDIYQWWLSVDSDQQNSRLSSRGDVGNPGEFSDAVSNCPTLGSGSCCMSGACSVMTLPECNQNLGLYLGDGTNCTLDPCPSPTNAEMRITEYMYDGFGGEFLELTNVGTVPIDMVDWSFADGGRIPGAVDLSALQTVLSGESVILAEAPAAAFASHWGLSGVTILTLPEGELGRNDEINLFDPSGTLVDRVTYGDQEHASIRTQDISGWPCSAALGQNNIFAWRLSFVGDPQGSTTSAGTPPNVDIGSPGVFVDYNCSGGPATPLLETWGLKHRYISIDALTPNPGHTVFDIKATLTATLVNGVTAIGSEWWAGVPDAACISIMTPTRPATPPDWAGCDTIHLTSCGIIPTSTYDIIVVDGTSVSDPPLVAATQARPGVKWWGDVVGSFDAGADEWLPPNGTTNIDDAVAGIKTFQDPNRVGPGCGISPCNATHVSVTDVHPTGHPLQPWGTPNKQVDINDVFGIVLGFQGIEFPGRDLGSCPVE